MRIEFMKMQGLGNDFLVFDAAAIASDTPLDERTLRALADRHTGVGFDQALMLESPRDPASRVFYRIFNSDGTEVEQCGNGARCIAALLYARAARTRPRLDHGQPRRTRARPRPRRWPGLGGHGQFREFEEPFEFSLKIEGKDIGMSALRLGNPHAVLRVPDVKTAPVELWGPSVQRHPHFPHRANVGFMQILGRNHILLRVYERGAGETQACGTGACAAVAVGRAPRVARRRSAGGFAGRHGDGFLGGSGPAHLADRAGHHGFYRFDRFNAIHGSQTMTTSHARGIKQDVLNDTSVADYLLTYPDFFERNSQLLTKLRLPHVRDVAATVSLVERQVEVLRERNQALERKLKELVDVARANDALADRIHRLSQRLIGTRTLAEAISAIETSLREDFDAMNSVLVLFLEEARALEPAMGRFLRVANPADEDIRTFDSLVEFRKAALRPGARCAARLSVRQRFGGNRLGGAHTLGSKGRARHIGHRRERCGTLSSRHEHRIPAAHRRARDLRADALNHAELSGRLLIVQASERERIERFLSHFNVERRMSTPYRRRVPPRS